MHIIKRPDFLYFANGQLMRQTTRAWIGQPMTDHRSGKRYTLYRHATGQVQVASLTAPQRVA